MWILPAFIVMSTLPEGNRDSRIQLINKSGPGEQSRNQRYASGWTICKWQLVMSYSPAREGLKYQSAFDDGRIMRYAVFRVCAGFLIVSIGSIEFA